MIPTSGAVPRVSLESCYRDLRGDAAARSAAETLLGRRHWLHDTAEFDQRTGEMLAGPLSRVCDNIREVPAQAAHATFKDRLYRIVEHIDAPMQDILRSMHQGLVREHALLPIRAVRELDSASFFALSRRPGRTIREKLADRPYLLAVERRWTTDSSENRLVKALCIRLAHLLRARTGQQAPAEAGWIDDFSSLIEGWLHSPAANEIGRWENLPPNNVLLRHRDYRRLWDAWLWSQTLDADMQRDQVRGLEQWTTIVFWTMVSRLAGTDGVRLLEQPCHPDYESFSILPARSGSDGQVAIDGVLGTPTGGRRIGVVSRTAGDRRTSKMGSINLPNGESVSFASEAFASREESDRVRVGTGLVFDIVVAADGARRALRAERLQAPRGFQISVKGADTITIAPPHGAATELHFSRAGPYVRAEVGSKLHVLELSAVTGATVALDALSAALGTDVRLGKPPVDAQVPLCVPFCAVDLCRIRPRFSTDDRSGALPFRLLWQLWVAAGRESVELDLGIAGAISLGTGLPTISILDLLAAETEIATDSLSRAARFFVAKLAGAVSTEALTYIVPDATDEFALGTLRRTINSTFRRAEPLPRSIATVFAWQSAATFAESGVRDGDYVIVVDTVGNTLSATPLLVRQDMELARRLPESTGIYWERIPTVLICEGAATSTALALATLEQSGCSFPAAPARIFGIEGLRDEGSGISWLGEDDSWFTPPHSLDRAVNSAFGDIPDLWIPLARALDHELRQMRLGARIHVLPASEVVRALSLDAPGVHHGHDVILVGEVANPARGGVTLHRWQARAGDIPLWRDHLPALSMRIIENSRHSRFYLVRDATVAPRRGQAIPIEIQETFVLPAGLQDYRFPLLQGVGGGALRYEAHLRSPAFPLQKDLQVSLRLTYTYGSDTPYDLVFKPIVETPALNFVRAEWRLREDAEELPAHFPALPPSLPWEKLAQYPKRDSAETSDLLEWVRMGFERLARRAAVRDSPRRSGVVTGRGTDRNAERYFFAQSECGSVFCHQSEFIEAAATEGIQRGDSLYFNVEVGEKGPRGRAIALSTDARSEEGAFRQLTWGLADEMRRGLRFPVLIIWSEGRTIADQGCPSDFQEVFRQSAAVLLSLREPRRGLRADSARMLADEALWLLCCMHADAPPEAVDSLREIFRSGSPDVLRWHYRHIALALGACQLDWQRGLLADVISVLESQQAGPDVHAICLGILANAIWRCGDALNALSNGDLGIIVARCNDVLTETQLRIEAGRQGWSPLSLKDHLELVLGLLRTRAADDPDRKLILAPRTPATRALARTIENILDSVSKHDIRIDSRLSLDIAIPRELSQTPRLLYALKLYLTGDDGAQAIRVLDVREDENDHA